MKSLVIFLLFIAGCGVSKPSKKSTYSGPSNQPIECNYLTCQSETQFCMRSKIAFAEEDVFLTSECVEKEEPGFAFSCKQGNAATLKHFENSRNCNYGHQCQDDNGAVTVTCLSTW